MNTIHLFLTILLITITFPAYATRIDVTKMPTEPLMGGISRCTPRETQILTEAVRAVQMRATDLRRNWPLMDLLHTKENFVIPENRIWVEGSPNNSRYQNFWGTIGGIFDKIAAADINIQCEISSDRVCSSSSVLAYVKFFLGKPIKMVHICPLLFTSDQDAVNSTLFHELSHYTSSTEDYAMDWWTRTSVNIEHAAMDAYFVERFMNEEPARVLRTQIWFWWWPKKANP